MENVGEIYVGNASAGDATGATVVYNPKTMEEAMGTAYGRQDLPEKPPCVFSGDMRMARRLTAIGLPCAGLGLQS